jgi:hypothetical protein
MAKKTTRTVRPRKKVAKLDALKQVNLNAAGLDIGDDEIYAAVPEGRTDASVKVFHTFTADLEALADWLETCGIDTIAMESTGVYWIPAFEVLEARGFEVYLVNARHIKNVTGRKTDILDCQWIQQLHTYSLLRPSFRPPPSDRGVHPTRILPSSTCGSSLPHGRCGPTQVDGLNG